MTAAFAPIPPIPGELGVFTFDRPGPAARERGGSPGTSVDRGIDWGNIEAQALGALIIRAAYLDDERLLASVAPFIPSYRSFVRLTDPALAGYRPVVIDCGQYRTVALHGVVNNTQYSSIALDYLVPRYTTGALQYLSSAAGPMNWFAAWWLANEQDSPPVNLIAHSFGGVFGAYWLSLNPAVPVVPRAMFFGVPKLGPTNARRSLLQCQLRNWATFEDFFVGMPPSYVRLNDVPFVRALSPGVFGQLAAVAIKAKLDAQWSVLESSSVDADGLMNDSTMRPIRQIDNGANWYRRTGVGTAGLFSFTAFQSALFHRSRVYYDRLRAQFTQWSILSDAAGPGGREADVAALAITAAEMGG